MKGQDDELTDASTAPAPVLTAEAAAAAAAIPAEPLLALAFAAEESLEAVVEVAACRYQFSH